MDIPANYELVYSYRTFTAYSTALTKPSTANRRNAIYNSADASGEGEVLKAKTASRKIYILSLTISVDAEMWVELQDEDSNAITCKHWFKAGGGKTITYPPEAPLVLNVVNKDLEVITEGAGNIGVEITGYLAV